MKTIVTGAILLSLCTSAVTRAEPEDFTAAYAKCATTQDDRQRLACFDKMTAGMVKKYQATKVSTNANGGYEPMELIDLKTDIKSLSGKRVTVIGSLQMLGEMAMLKSEPFDMTPIMVSVEKLPREDRKQALRACLRSFCHSSKRCVNWMHEKSIPKRRESRTI